MGGDNQVRGVGVMAVKEDELESEMTQTNRLEVHELGEFGTFATPILYLYTS